MSRDWSSVGEVPGQTVAGMVSHLEPDWEVTATEQSRLGTDFVATVDVRTPEGARRVVLKAMTAEWASPGAARAEYRLLSTVDRRTEIPVPTVFGSCDEHPEYPAPFFLMSHVEGTSYESERPPGSTRRQTLREAGRYLAALHELDVLDGDQVGRLGVEDGALTVLDSDSGSQSFHGWLLESYEENLDSLAEGGYFPELAEDRTRFADIVPDLRQFLRERIPELPEPDPPVVCHSDYRYGNLLVDPETGETRAVLDWGLLTAGAPAYNLAETESLMISPETDGPELAAELREAFRSRYARRRTQWCFDEETRERMRVYRLTCRIDAMACLPLWHEDASPAERDEVAARHRAFVSDVL